MLIILHPKVPQHENADEHRNSYIQWKELERRLKLSLVIESDLEKSIQYEKIKWRNILKAVVNAILYCVENNLALRGSSNNINDHNCGVFLKTIKLISKHDPEIRCHIEESIKHPGRVTYFSNTIQNKVICLLYHQVEDVIIQEITKAVYFAISFDCTPDIAHKEQMTQIIRYVKIAEDRTCSIEERFMDFIETKEKIGEGFAEEILNKLKMDGIDIKYCRAQCYDNGSNMAGKYKGVQARILAINEYADYLRCCAHSVNLLCVHAASTSPKMITFFWYYPKFVCLFFFIS